MELKEMITQRKSFRKYTGEPVSQELLQTIGAFIGKLKPLYEDIGLECRIVTGEQVRFYFPWKTPQLVAVYSRNNPGYLENAGFMIQQLDLYLQSLGLGSCWLGLGKLRDDVQPPEGMEFVILLAFGYTEEKLRSGAAEFKREPMGKISDREDPVLEPARLAPSSTNSQPWYFTHEGNTLHAFCNKGGILKHKMLGYMNRIDMGIALAHLYVANPDTFCFTRREGVQEPEGYRYTGSITL